MPKFEAILPLTAVQQSLLAHRQFSDVDQGELHVEFTITGKLDQDRAQQAWNQLADLHPVLRTTIHTEKVKTPVQIIHPYRPQEIKWFTYSSDDEIENLKKEDRKQGYALDSYPINPWRVFSHSNGEKHRVLWFCHHILLDGWSTANLLADWVKLYHKTEVNRPPNMQQYVRWLKDQRQLDIHEKRDYFFSTGKYAYPSRDSQRPKHSESKHIGRELSGRITEFCSQHNLTLNSFFMGAWALALHRWSGEANLSFATTLSGRQIDFPNITSLAGLLSNIAPVFSKNPNSLNPSEWLSDFQLRSAHTTSFQSVAFHELQERWRQEGIQFHADSLFTFENFPWSDIHESELSITEFSSGVTANFPISMTVIPHGEMRYNLELQEGYFSIEEAHRLSGLFTESLMDLVGESELSFTPGGQIRKQEKKELGLNDLPTNSVESAWMKIWTKVIGLTEISIRDNFFEIGGKSIHAIQIFAEWEKTTGQNLPPALLLEKPSIKELAQVSESKDQITWSSLVPLQLTGSSDPLFCIHAGGAHVFVYRELADQLKNHRPVYAIQPYGLDGKSEHNSSIEQMARAYWDEIVEIQANGRIVVLGYCFSAAIVAEMIQISKETKRDIHIIVVDSAPGLTYGREKLPISGRILKLWNMIRSGQTARIKEMVEGKWDSFKAKFLSQWESEQMKNFRKVEAQLSTVYQKYRWKDSNQTIHLIRSSEFAQRSDKDIHVEEWHRLVGDKLKIYIVDGSHKTLFESPTVSSLAQAIESTLDISE